jgi:hypothetical protein
MKFNRIIRDLNNKEISKLATASYNQIQQELSETLKSK